MKILIIDDENIIRRALGRALESKGHTVYTAEDAFQGQKLWAELLPDVVFLDIIMPNKTGPELVADLKDFLVLNPVVIILMSAYSGDYDTNLAKYKNIDLFVKKPFDNIFSLVEKAEELVR